MQEGATTWPKPTHPVHYEVNVRGGGFDTARDRFQVWKHEPPVSRPDRLMFEGKREVRWLGNAGFDDTEAVSAWSSDVRRQAAALPAKLSFRRALLLLDRAPGALRHRGRRHIDGALRDFDRLLPGFP